MLKKPFKAAVITEMAVAHHTQLPTLSQLPPSLAEKPLRGLLPHYMALVKRRVQGYQVKAGFQTPESVAQMEMAITVRCIRANVVPCTL